MRVLKRSVVSSSAASTSSLGVLADDDDIIADPRSTSRDSAALHVPQRPRRLVDGREHEHLLFPVFVCNTPVFVGCGGVGN